MLDTHLLSGFVTIGDSVQYSLNTLCAKVQGYGYYNCDKPLHGRFIAFYSLGQADNYPEGVFKINSLSAFGSANLITTATIAAQPVVRDGFQDDFANNLSILHPRASTIATDYSL